MSQYIPCLLFPLPFLGTLLACTKVVVLSTTLEPSWPESQSTRRQAVLWNRNPDTSARPVGAPQQDLPASFSIIIFKVCASVPIWLCPSREEGRKASMPNSHLMHGFSQTQEAELLFLAKKGGQGGEKEAIRNQVLRVLLKVSLKPQKFSPRSVHTAPLEKLLQWLVSSN